jgi:hypothetical protein
VQDRGVKGRIGVKVQMSEVEGIGAVRQFEKTKSAKISVVVGGEGEGRREVCSII